MSAEPVYKFIESCLKIIQIKTDGVVTSFDKESLLKIKVDSKDIEESKADEILNIEKLKEVFEKIAANPLTPISVQESKDVLIGLLPQIGYKPATTDDNIFIKDNDSASAGKKFYVINIGTGNAWAINKYPIDGVDLAYGGKKRKTNRRKHRRSNRKTLGRKK